MLTIHHLGHSQSERIVWLCEELGVPYELVQYKRDPVTILSPPDLKALHPLGAAPMIRTTGSCWRSPPQSPKALLQGSTES